MKLNKLQHIISKSTNKTTSQIMNEYAISSATATYYQAIAQAYELGKQEITTSQKTEELLIEEQIEHSQTPSPQIKKLPLHLLDFDQLLNFLVNKQITQQQYDYCNAINPCGIGSETVSSVDNILFPTDEEIKTVLNKLAANPVKSEEPEQRTTKNTNLSFDTPLPDDDFDILDV